MHLSLILLDIEMSPLAYMYIVNGPLKLMPLLTTPNEMNTLGF